MSLTDKEKSEIIYLIWSVRPKTKVWIFGSRASANYRNDSDLDLFLESNEPFTQKEIWNIAERLKQSSLPFACDVLCKEFVTPAMLKTILATRVLLELP